MSKEYISFSLLSPKVAEELVTSVAEESFCEELRDMLASLAEIKEDGAEVAVCLIPDALLIRIYDGGEYLFPSPVGLVDGWDLKRAVRLIAEYTVKEMIPLSFCEVLRDDLAVLGEVFVSMDASAYEDDEDLFLVRVRNECMRLEDYPSLSSERLTLRRIDADRLPTYARLCRDDENNKYWGYDAKEDNLEDTDSYFLEVAEREFELGIAMTLGVYLGEELIGESVIYAFDYMGGASAAIRLLPEYQGQGLGCEAFSLLIEAARNIGLSELFCEVKPENERSLRMTSRYMKENLRDGEKVYYSLKL